MAAIDTSVGTRTDGAVLDTNGHLIRVGPRAELQWSDRRLGRTARDRRFPFVGLRGSLRRRQPLPAHGVPAAQGERRRRHPHLPLASRPLRSGERRHVRSLGRRRPDLPHRRRGWHRLRRCAAARRRPRGARQGTALGRSGAGSQSGRRQERARVARGRCPAGARSWRSAVASARPTGAAAGRPV